MGMYQFDLTSQTICDTSGSDNSLTVPSDTQTQLNTVGKANNVGSYYFFGVAGAACYLNIGATATSSNILMPIGVTNIPVYLPPGAVIHALAASGTGQFWIVRARIL